MTDQCVRCGNCMEPHRAHRRRMEAAPICPRGGTVYRAATPEELEAGYRAAFPEGPVPVASFDLNKPGDIERARALLSPEALTCLFGPGGGGMKGFMEQMENPL